MTIKEIKQYQAARFEGVEDSKLVEAYGTVNVFKNELASLEKDIKEVINERKSNGTGFSKDVQLSLSFPTGVVTYSVNPRQKTVYTLTISSKELYDLLESFGINPESFMKVEYKITELALKKLYEDPTIPGSIKLTINKSIQESLSFSCRKEVN